MIPVRLDLNVSELPPIEPLERILETLPRLGPGDWLAVRHRQEPYPLYSLLRDGGYDWRVRVKGLRDVEILIWRQNDSLAEQAIEAGS